MMKEASIITEVLPTNLLEKLKAHIASNIFTPVDIGGTDMYAMPIPEDVKQWVVGYIEEEVGQELEEVAIYARLNAFNTDTTFRIHSDGLIQGQQPTIAAVLYLTTGPTGTALYEHPEHGHEGVGKVFQEDDGRWTMVDFCDEVENTLFIYPANHFHSRYPHQARQDRVVIVSFLKEKGK